MEGHEEPGDAPAWYDGDSPPPHVRHWFRVTGSSHSRHTACTPLRTVSSRSMGNRSNTNAACGEGRSRMRVIVSLIVLSLLCVVGRATPQAGHDYDVTVVVRHALPLASEFPAGLQWLNTDRPLSLGPAW